MFSFKNVAAPFVFVVGVILVVLGLQERDLPRKVADIASDSLEWTINAPSKAYHSVADSYEQVFKSEDEPVEKDAKTVETKRVAKQEVEEKPENIFEEQYTPKKLPKVLAVRRVSYDKLRDERFTATQKPTISEQVVNSAPALRGFAHGIKPEGRTSASREGFARGVYIPKRQTPSAGPSASVDCGDIPVRARKAISSDIGMRKLPGRKARMHKGVDIPAVMGDDVCAYYDGIVTRTPYEKRGFGHYVEIDHGQGRKTIYAHASKIHVKPGDRVKRGQRIASVGTSGVSTGPHVHFETIGMKNPISRI